MLLQRTRNSGKKGQLYTSLVALNDSSDELFDVPDQELIEFDQTEVDWSSPGTPTECAPGYNA
ncbi:hypothetical protein LINPERPRIM_LOCUS9476, partial [Linum perenne]